MKICNKAFKVNLTKIKNVKKRSFKKRKKLQRKNKMVTDVF